MEINEQILEKSRRFDAISNCPLLGILVFDPEGTIVEVDPKALSLFGYRAEEINGMDLRQLASGDEQAQLIGEYIYGLIGSRSGLGRTECELRRKDGNLLWVEVQGSRLFKDGMFYGVICVMVDITARKRHEKSIRESEQNLLITLESIGDAVITTDLAGRVQSVNKKAKKLIGWNEQKMRGRPFREVFRIVDSATGDEIDLIGRVLSVGDIVTLERGAVLLSKSGREYHIADSAAPLMGDGGVSIKGVVVTFSDKTELYRVMIQLEENKERLELAIEGAELGTWDWDVQSGKFVHNDRWAKMFGYKAGELRADIDLWRELIHPNDRPAVYENLEKHKRGLISTFQAEHRFRCKSGDYIWVLSKGRVIKRDHNGQPLRACGTMLDITERKRILIELEKKNGELYGANKRLQEFDRAKSEFVSMASHELRTPITAILGFTQTLLASDITFGSREREEFLRIIEKEAKGLKTLVSNLLDISKIESGLIEHRIKPVNLKELAADVLKILLSDKSKDVTIDADEWGEKPVLCDEKQIRRVFINIMENALRYGDQVSIQLSGDEGRRGVIITDNGPGISEKEKEKLFEKFYRVQGEQRPSSGSGLGLTIARHIILAHEGDVRVESSPGQGTSFHFYIKA